MGNASRGLQIKGVGRGAVNGGVVNLTGGSYGEEGETIEDL